MALALVTGATSGLGLTFARALAARGDDVVLVARDEARLDAVAAELRAAGRTVHVVPADLATRDGVARVTDAVREHRIDLLVNNAGSSIGKFFGDTDVADEDAQLDLMVKAPMDLMAAALEVMRPRRSGQILNVASVAAFTPRGTYSAHKAWIVNLSQWMNIQYAAEGIVTTALCPGFVRTEFHQRMGVDPSDVPRWMWTSTDQQVRGALCDLEKGKPLSVPTARYKVLATVARYAPAGLVAAVAKKGRKVAE
ncbi:SDR family NAD(P)-dependent oxidoreductase [Mumia zhuanghuii]|uniref:SDR family NAD(P)-dependent oxidoreductase n=1 Tax=Mumia zhuanghuii TaxID=2585211 RepID=A0A5C4M963_9ACTN|nr:SDR family NAD(P)-dependent oxidoreductase [Mumia zhuanghuii]TNC30934.1 SDR family NAD(P)-dependent oxidoreductase [Mumia zhuanghuii]TNC49419.1 SDR family NAD(P)-dependent oxidoreductase [Mumia zhuanghuii]